MKLWQSNKLRFLIGVVLALMVLGLALHQHDDVHSGCDDSCIICHSITCWLPAIFTAFVILIFLQPRIFRGESYVHGQQSPSFAQPRLRGPPSLSF